MDSTPTDSPHTDSTPLDSIHTRLSSATPTPLDITTVSLVETVSPSMLALYVISSMVSFVSLMSGVTTLLLKIIDSVHAVTTCHQCCYFWCCCPPHIKTEHDGFPSPPTPLPPPPHTTSYGGTREKTTSKN